MKPSIPYITRLHPQTPIKIKEIGDDEYSIYIADCKLINEFDYYQRRLREIELNIEDFFDSKEYYTTLLQKSYTTQIDFDFKKEGFIDINRCFINIITSFRSLTEHCEKKVIQVFGEDSAEFTSFKFFLNDLHSANLVYKLFDILRNYSVHSNYPIEFVNFDRITFDLSHQDCWFEVGIFFSKERFRNSKTIRKKMKADIDLLEDFERVEPLIFKLMPIVNLILHKFIVIAKSEYVTSSQRIVKLSREIGLEKIGLTKCQINGAKIDYKTIVIPVKTAEQLIEYTI